MGKPRTFAHIPAQMPQTIQRVERKRSSEDHFACILGSIGKAADKLDDVCAVEGAGCNKVSEREAVEDWELRYTEEGRS
jgi:hypothetical protein